jgi:Ca-activated chloride channel homolog
MKGILACGLVLFFATAIPAQRLPPALVVQGPKGSEALLLSKVRTEVRVIGYVAETATSLTFTSQLPNAVEGDLYFPLPEGATVSGYALDVAAKMIDGVAVERDRGRTVFEEIISRRIDPGLIEWTVGNTFKTRVFPIPPRGSRTIRVQYVSELLSNPDGPAYHLPLHFKDPIAEFSLRVEVVKPAAQPRIARGRLKGFAFAPWHESYAAEATLQNAAPADDVVIVLPDVRKSPVCVERADDGQVYFALHDMPQPAEKLPGPIAPKHVVVYWDASGSRGQSDHSREIRLLKDYLAAQHFPVSGAKRTIQVDLVLFRNAAAKPKRFTLTGPKCSDLIAELHAVQYDGGTQMASITPPPGAPRPDYYLLFSDGVSNFGEQKPVGFNAPVYAFSGDPEADHSFLQHLATATGGQYFNLGKLKDSEVLAAIGRTPYCFLGAIVDGGEAAGLYPELPQPIQGRFTLTGKLVGNEALVTLQYGLAGKVLQHRAFHVAAAAAVEGSLLRRLWAQKKLADLMAFQERNQKQIIELGQEYGMVTPYTSLIVLESLDQYVQYGIAPPTSLPEMRRNYAQQVSLREADRQKARADKLEQVVGAWQTRVEWWKREFVYSPDFKYHDSSQSGRAEPPRVKPAKKRPSTGPHSPRVAGCAFRMGPPSYFGGPNRVGHSYGGMGGGMMGGMGGMGTGMAGGVGGMGGGMGDAAFGAGGAGGRGGSVRGSGARAAGSGAGSFAPPPPSVTPPAAEATAPATRVPAALAPSPAEPAAAKDHAAKTHVLVQPPDPGAPYLKALRVAAPEDRFAVYMAGRVRHGGSPAYYMDCAEFFRRNGEPDVAIQVLSNIAEMDLDDVRLLRVLGHSLAEIGQVDLAAATYETVLQMQPEEPQSYRDLALILARRAETLRHDGAEDVDEPEDAGRGEQDRAFARTDCARAIELLYEVVLRPWGRDYPEIEIVALEEINHLILRAEALGVKKTPVDPRLVQNLDLDLRIVVTWFSNGTDVDLRIVEPSDEKATPSHNRTTIGGLASANLAAYGPEEYLIHKAMRGKYRIEAEFRDNGGKSLPGPLIGSVDIFVNYGRPDETHRTITFRRDAARRTATLGKVQF